MTIPSDEHDTPRHDQQPWIPATVDAVRGGLTVSFEIRYVDGAAGERVAAAQATAIEALLTWLAHQDATTNHSGPLREHLAHQQTQTSVPRADDHRGR